MVSQADTQPTKDKTLTEVSSLDVSKYAKAGANIIKTISNPQFGTFIVVVWLYSLAIELLMVLANPYWLEDPALWIEYFKNAVKVSVLLFVAILGKVLRMSYQSKEDVVEDEMKVISKATLSIINKCLMSSDTELRDHANSVALGLIGQGVSLYDHAFHDKESMLIRRIASEIEIEKKK